MCDGMCNACGASGARLVRRAAGHNQTDGIVERVFVVSAGIAAVVFSFWFLVIAGPGPQIAPWH